MSETLEKDFSSAEELASTVRLSADGVWSRGVKEGSGGEMRGYIRRRHTPHGPPVRIPPSGRSESRIASSRHA